MGAAVWGAACAHRVASTRIDWSADDSSRITFLQANGRAYQRPHLTLWAPDDSVDVSRLEALLDSLDDNIARLETLIGGPYAWQRIGTRPVEFYLSPGRFVSHASGRGAVFISVSRIRDGTAPFLHEASHELLAPPAPFSPDEYPDSVTSARMFARFPLWLSEGLPDYLAQSVSAATGFHEGDVFEIGGLARVDSVCATRLTRSPRRAEIEARVGAEGAVEALFTTERGEVAPIFYACSQSFTKLVVDRIGVPATVGLFPLIAPGRWRRALEKAAGASLDDLRKTWLESMAARAATHRSRADAVFLPRSNAAAHIWRRPHVGANVVDWMPTNPKGASKPAQVENDPDDTHR